MQAEIHSGPDGTLLKIIEVHSALHTVIHCSALFAQGGLAPELGNGGLNCTGVNKCQHIALALLS